jgi:hypothetical protein
VKELEPGQFIAFSYPGGDFLYFWVMDEDKANI